MKLYLINILKLPVALAIFCCAGTSLSAQVKFESNIYSLSRLAQADSSAKLHVRKVIISGNRKTKDYIILREMHIKPGDSVVIATLLDELEKAQHYIYNTTLFAEVKVSPVIVSAFDFDIDVFVKEKWYIYPLPELQLADRSYNEWIAKHKGNLNRFNYGIKFEHYNLTGRKDKLRVYLLNGYTRTIDFNYRAPYSNSALTNGFSVNAGFFQSREMAFSTGNDNSILYYKKPSFVRTLWNFGSSYSIRKAIKITQVFSINYSHINIDDSVVTQKYNSNYFNKPVSTIGFVDVSYSFFYTDADNILYPLKGMIAGFGVSKRGLGFSGGINMFSVKGEFNRYWDLGKKWYAGSMLQANIKLPLHQAYINERALGYDNSYIRGLEMYAIDGVAFGLLKFNLKKQILNFTAPFIKNSRRFDKIPFRFYAKIFADAGYSYLKTANVPKLNNKLLYSTGIGVDIVTLYDIQLRFEYSINQLGQKNLFLHNEKGF